jgi:hypothetical protein
VESVVRLQVSLRKAGLFLEIGGSSVDRPYGRSVRQSADPEFKQFLGSELQLIGSSARACARHGVLPAGFRCATIFVAPCDAKSDAKASVEPNLTQNVQNASTDPIAVASQSHTHSNQRVNQPTIIGNYAICL